MANLHELKVTFSEIEDSNSHSNILVQVLNQFVVNLHLGFLQVNHKYEIKFQFQCTESMYNMSNLKKPIANDNVQIIEINTAPGPVESKLFVHNVTVHLFAYKEKFLKETVSLQFSDTKSLTFLFNARVLGRDKGTPLLKNGIKCIGFNDSMDVDIDKM